MGQPRVLGAEDHAVAGAHHMANASVCNATEPFTCASEPKVAVRFWPLGHREDLRDEVSGDQAQQESHHQLDQGHASLLQRRSRRGLCADTQGSTCFV